MRGRDFLIGVGTAVAGIVLLGWIIPGQIMISAGQGDEVSPALFPRILGWMLVILGALHAASNWPRGGRLLPSAGDGRGDAWRRGARVVGAVGITALYVFLMPVLGYRLATALATTAAVLYLGRGGLVRALVVGVAGALVIAEMFARGLNVPLPRGDWMD